MASLNQCNFIGNVGQDPKIKKMNDGTTVANFSIACNESWNSKSGQKQEKTEWVNCVAWRKLAETIEKYVKKGQQIFISGKLQTRSWEKDGITHYITEIIANSVIFLGTAGDVQKPQVPDNTIPPEPDTEIPF